MTEAQKKAKATNIKKFQVASKMVEAAQRVDSNVVDVVSELMK